MQKIYVYIVLEFLFNFNHFQTDQFNPLIVPTLVFLALESTLK